MALLAVTLRLHGAVVDQGAFEVRKSLSLGEARKARMPFPGAEVYAELRDGGIWVRGVELREGDQLTIGVGDLDVELHHLEAPEPVIWPKRRVFDRRFAAFVAVTLLCATWIDGVDKLILSPGHSSQALGDPGWVDHSVEVPGSESSLTIPEDLDKGIQAGEPHHADDHGTGIAWSDWAFETGSSSGKTAPELYRAGQFKEAIQAIEGIEGDASAALLRARSLVRLGQYREARDGLLIHTEAKPQDSRAQLEIRVLLARMGQPESPRRMGLSQGAPWSERLHAEALLSAASDDEDAALEVLEELFSQWSEVEEGHQSDIRISLAIDPLFASMRRHPALISMLYRHLGSTAPARLR